MAIGTIINSTNYSLGGGGFSTSKYAGPYIDGNDNLYIVTSNTTGALTIHIYKSTDKGVNWSSIANVTHADTGGSAGRYRTVQDPGSHHIHIAHSINGNPIRYHKFAMSSASTGADTFVSSNVVVQSSPGISVRMNDIAVRSSGDVLIAGQSATEKVHGTDYNRWTMYEDTGSGFGSLFVGGTGTQEHHNAGSIRIGAAGKLHGSKSDGVSASHDFSLADGSSTPSSYESIWGQNLSGPGHPRAAYFDDSGTERIWYVVNRSASGNSRIAKKANDGTPTNADEGITSTLDGRIYLFHRSDHPTSGRWIMVAVKVSDSDIYFDENTGSGWGTDQVGIGSITANEMSVNCYFNPDNDFVIGVAYYTGIALLYDEIVLVAGAAGYTMTAEPGSFTWTGSAAGLTVGRVLAADPGSFTWTGSAVGLIRGRTMAAEPGSFTWTGSAVGLTVGRVLAAEPGSFTWTGSAVGLIYGAIANYVLIADSFVYVWTGSEVDLRYFRIPDNTPDERIKTIPGFDRTVSVGYNDRSYAVKKQDRIKTVD